MLYEARAPEQKAGNAPQALETLTEFIRIARVKQISGLSKSTLLRWIAAKKFPSPVVIEKDKNGRNAVCLWDLAECLSWRAEQFSKREERERSA